MSIDVLVSSIDPSIHPSIRPPTHPTYLRSTRSPSTLATWPSSSSLAASTSCGTSSSATASRARSSTPSSAGRRLVEVYEELYTYTTCVRALDLLNCRALSHLHVYSLRPPRLAVAARLQGRQRAGRRPRCVLPARRAHHGVRAVVLVASAAVLRVVSMIRFGLVTHR